MMLPKCPCSGFPAPAPCLTPPPEGPSRSPAAACEAATPAESPPSSTPVPECAYRTEVSRALLTSLVRPSLGQHLSPMHSRVPGCDHLAQPAGAPALEAAPGVAPEAAPRVWVEQLVVRAGDVVLMHPFTLHSGTTNVDTQGAPRLMINGMARVRPEAFEARGGARLMQELAAWDVSWL